MLSSGNKAEINNLSEYDLHDRVNKEREREREREREGERERERELDLELELENFIFQGL